MPFHFRKTELPGRALRRAGRERIRMALARLRRSRRPAAIHGARKDIKKLRAIFQLARDEIGGNTFHKATNSLRAAAKRLAVSRDARVMLKAFEKLAGRDAEKFGVCRAALEKHARRETRQFRRNDSAGVAKQFLKRIDRCVKNLKIRPQGWAAIEPGLRRSYRQGRHAWKTARRRPLPENFHAWRKQVKCFGYQLRLVCPDWPGPVRGLTHQLEQLGEMLGDDHDLELLKHFVMEEDGDPAGEPAVLRRRIERRQKELRARALEIGQDLFAKRPAAVWTRLGGYWNGWRGH